MAYKQELTRQVQLEDTVTDSTKKGVTANGIKQALENVQPAGDYANGKLFVDGEGEAAIYPNEYSHDNKIAINDGGEIELIGLGDGEWSQVGTINIESSQDAVSVTAGGGDVNITAGDTLDLSSQNGMNVETTDGPINVTTNNGDMNVEVDGYMGVESTGTLNISSANGNANLTAEESVTVRAQTQDLDLEAGESVNVKAGVNGDHNIKKQFEVGGSTVTETYPVFGELLRERVEVDDTVANHALAPNQLTVFTSRTSALTLTLGAGATHTAFVLPKEYHFFIVIGDTAPTVTFPSGITWAGGAPTIAANKTYEFSIQEGVAIGIEA